MKQKGGKKKSGIVYSTNPDFDFSNPFDALKSEVSPKGKHRIRVLLDRKNRKGKAVTLITGFEGSEEELATLGKSLKSHCGVGGSTKDGEIILQGDQRDKAIAWLLKDGFSDVKKSGG